ncbi:MAG TPA: bifunctional 4-hydroxy-2-oxoglutarate aldolase/2-dehydro-3-deoxy-phosphogluconate aldolase [Spirochaetia bacterium]|nr:bifunctional 4-hydroxy-2-oxoglutarate aldolase/2-dehydro-3-deoxy-phosphogluconate aldolase [Spirochaetia bacterium]
MASTNEVFDQLARHVVIPVIAIDSVDAALPLADALIEGGLPVAEITFRTAAAAQVIAIIARERPQMILGAGTVLTSENLGRACDSGAKFGVAPGLNPDVVAEAAHRGLPFMPGVITPTEVEQALALGLKLLKFFPAEVFGGLKVIKALAAPYGHAGVRFMPTGGVNTGNLAEYLGEKTVACVGGTWIATREAIAEKKWAQIRDNCKAAIEIARKVRG